MPISSMACAVDGEMCESVMMWSTSFVSTILLKPRRPNLDESASTMVFCTVCIITRLRLASIMLVVVMPKSRSMPSTPINNLLQEKSLNADSAYLPTTDKLLWRRIPPSSMMSTLWSRMRATSSDAVITVSLSVVWMLRANAWTVVPDAMRMESRGVTSCAAAAPMSRFSYTYSRSFSLTFLFSL